MGSGEGFGLRAVPNPTPAAVRAPGEEFGLEGGLYSHLLLTTYHCYY